MLERLFISTVEISLSSSLIIIVLLLISPFIKKVYISKWRYLLWLILTIRLIIPFNITLPSTPVNITIPTNITNFNPVNEPITNGNVIPQAELTEPQLPTAPVPSHNYTLIEILSYVWLLGAIIFIFRIIIAYIRFHYKMKRNSVTITNYKVLSHLEELCIELNIMKPAIRLSKSSCSPMIYGFIKPTLYLPDINVIDYDLEVILRHELIHLKRHDLWFKLLLIIANAIHWFNPLVYFMVKSANADIEFSCDDEVIKNYDINLRKQYSLAILNAMKKGRSKDVNLTTQFKGGKKIMKSRFSNILNTTKKKKGKLTLLLLSLTIIISGFLVACTEIEPIASNQSTDNLIDENLNKEVQPTIENSENIPYSLHEYYRLGFSIELPENWENLIVINENLVEYSPNGGAGIEIYHKETRDAYPDKGALLYIDRWIGTWSEDAPPLQDNQSSIVLQTNRYTYMIRIPNDIQYSETDVEMAEAYQALSNQIDGIKTRVKDISNWISEPNAGYQTEADFLNSPDGIEYREVTFAAAKAVLTGDVETLQKQLLNPDDAAKHIETLANFQRDLVKFELKFTLSDIREDGILASYEFLPVDDDSYTYITMKVIKVDGNWKVDWLGAEK